MMRRVLLVLVLVGLVVGVAGWTLLTPPSPLRPASSAFMLEDVTVIEPGRTRLAHATVSVRDGAIAKVAPAADVGAERSARAFAGRFVLPGLVDMHAHLPPSSALKMSGYFAFLYLAHGVTSIREVGDADGTAVTAARAGIEAGTFPGPRIFSCGPFVAGGRPVRWSNTLVVDTPADAEPIAARIARDGHMCIKSYEDLSREKIDALKAAAARHGLQLLGHVPTRLAYEEALVPEVQHFFGVPPPASLGRDHVLNRAADWQDVDDARLDAIVAASLQHGIANTPTLVSSHGLLHYRDYQAARRIPAADLMPRLYPDVAWDPIAGLPFWRGIEAYLDRIEDAVAKKRALVRKLHRAGATLRVGTDSQQPFVAPGLSMVQEMGHFVDAGIPLEEVWAMATWQAAATLGLANLGRIEAGAPADLLVFAKDPTQDLAHFETLEAVVSKGKIYARTDLDTARDAYRRHFRGTFVDTVSIPAARLLLRRTVLRDY